MRCTPAGAVNARAQPVAEMQAAWYHWRLRTRRRHSRLGGCRAALDAIGFGPRRARRFGRVSDKPLSAPSWPTCTMSGRPATVAIFPKHLWRCSSPTAIMLSSPQSAAASRHRRTRRRSPPLHGTLPSARSFSLAKRLAAGRLNRREAKFYCRSSDFPLSTPCSRRNATLKATSTPEKNGCSTPGRTRSPSFPAENHSWCPEARAKSRDSCFRLRRVSTSVPRTRFLSAQPRLLGPFVTR